MAKPSSSYVLDSGNSLYTSLTNFYALLEGSGTTSVDKKGGNLATFTSSPAPTWQSDSEGPFVRSGSDGAYLTLASNIAVPTNTSFSIAFGLANVHARNQSMVIGDHTSTGNFWWMNEGSFDMTIQTTITGSQTFNSWAVDQVNRADYVLSFAYSGGNYTANAYQNGANASAAPFTFASVAGTINFNVLLNGYSSSGFSLIGDMYYCYFWNGRVA